MRQLTVRYLGLTLLTNWGRPGDCLTRRRFTRSCQVKQSPAPRVAGAGHWAHLVQPDAGAAVNISTLAQRGGHWRSSP